MEQHVEQELADELRKYAEDKDDGIEDIDKHYKHLRSLIRLVGDPEIGQQSLILNAPPGLGKTHQIKTTLATYFDVENVQYCSGFSSPLELYETLYHNRDNIIVLDDIEGVASNQRAVSILKAVVDTEGDKNFVEWKSKTSKLSDDVQDKFAFTGAIIMCFNHLPDNGNVDALVDRSIYYEIDFDYWERCEIIAAIAREIEEDGLTQAERLHVAKWIIRESQPHDSISLRTLFKCYAKYKKAREIDTIDWTGLAEEVLDFKKDEALAALRKILQDPRYRDNNDEAKKKFMDETGQCERQYWRKKKILDEERKEKIENIVQSLIIDR